MQYYTSINQFDRYLWVWLERFFEAIKTFNENTKWSFDALTSAILFRILDKNNITNTVKAFHYNVAPDDLLFEIARMVLPSILGNQNHRHPTKHKVKKMIRLGAAEEGSRNFQKIFES